MFLKWWRLNFERLKSYQKKYGVLGVLGKAISRVCSFVFSYRPLYIYRIMGAPQRDVKALCPLEIRKGVSEDIDLIVGLVDEWNQRSIRKLIQRHFDDGGELFLAFSRGRVVHYSWLFYHPGFREQLAYIHLKKDEAHIASAYTIPEFRGQNIYPVVLQHILKCALEKNIRKVCITSAPKNIASVRGIEKAGFCRVGKIGGFRLFGKMFNHHWSSIDDSVT